jgi:transposase InsO family protein
MLKGKLGTSARVFGLWDGLNLTNKSLMKTFSSIFKFDNSESAKFRLKVIKFSEEYGITGAVKAYGVSKASIMRWKQSLKKNKGKLESLIPKSQAPHRKRQMQLDYRIVNFIKELRENHHRLGKEKLKIFIDKFCSAHNIKTISVSTIGKIIKRNNFFFQPHGRIYHGYKYKRKINYKTKVKKSPHNQPLGYVEIDTISSFINGLKFYTFNAVDIKSRFQFSYCYKNNSSATALDFLLKLKTVFPYVTGIKTVQTDNGHEYMGKFHDYLEKEAINHNFIYHRCPKINGYVERANRSLREEFLDHYIDLAIENLNDFNHKLMQHLVWFNTKRPHFSLGNISPISFILKNEPRSHMYVTYSNAIVI